MLNGTEFIDLDTTLKIVLWIEAIVYLGIGIYELVDDFHAKPKPWCSINGRLNAWVSMQDKVGHKMHASVCFLLGFVALNGIIEGHINRFEIELIFVSLALITGIIWGMLPPGRLAVLTVVAKPEVWLQVIMYIFYAELVRPEIIGLCFVLNAWGVLVYFTKHRRDSLLPFTYENLREHILEAEGEVFLARIDKAAGYKSETGDSALAGETKS
jgi:hypothetical protein